MNIPDSPSLRPSGRDTSPAGEAGAFTAGKPEERIAVALERIAEELEFIGSLVHEFWSWLPDNESSIPLFSGTPEEGADSGTERDGSGGTAGSGGDLP